MTAVLQLESINFSYGRSHIIKDVSLSIDQGQILCLLGPSGTGKSTLLNLISGLLKPRSGRVIINGNDQSNIPVYLRKNIGYVFQSGEGLFPHLTVYENVAFPFKYGNRILPNKDWKKAVLDILNFIGLGDRKNESIWKLSGGMEQRVALARSLVYEPDILLLDEPLGSLDNYRKTELIEIMRRLHERLRTTFIYVTHDERESLIFSSHIGIMNGGRIEQINETVKVTTHPSTINVARIIGGWNIFTFPNQINDNMTNDEKMLISYVLGNIKRKGINSDISFGVPIFKTIYKNENSSPINSLNEVFSLETTIQWIQPWYNCHRISTKTQSGQSIIAEISNITEEIKQGKTINIQIKKEDIHVFE